MLAARHRLVDGDDFRHVVRRGRRAGGRHVVVHVSTPTVASPVTEQSVAEPSAAGPSADPTRVGFVVSKAVGNAVVRNQVKRRLRHLMRDRLVAVPSGARVVVRAQPGAAHQSAAALGADLDAALERASR